jgi:virulence factor Mce-like protein
VRTRLTPQWTRRLAALAALGIALVAVGLVFKGSGSHTVRAAFQSAIQVVPGQEVRVAGRKVGAVESIKEEDGEAVVGMKIGDDAWPLHRGTTARLRFGSVGGYAARFVELEPGPDSAPALPDGGALTSADTITPVEYDQIFNTFDKPTRRNLQGMLGNAAATLGDRGGDLARGLHEGAPALDRISNTMGDLGADPHALDKLVRAGARTSAALRSRDPQLRALLDQAASTFDELAGQARAQQVTLERFPAALTSGRATLRRLDSSLDGLDGLVADLGPGARGLREMAPTAYRSTATLHELAPLVTRTLTDGAQSVPDIDRLVRAGTTFMPKTGRVLHELSPMLHCIRPYTPELAGMWSTWLSFSGWSDDKAGYSRALLTVALPGMTPGSTMNSKQVVETYKGRIFYAMPRPPGLNAGKPWFLPECGAGPDALDASKDPENGGGG